MKLRITTFNCENLFGRYRMLNLPWDKRPTGYETRLQVFDVIALEPGRTGRIKPEEITHTQRITTANALTGARPDIAVVQEVENISTLRIFNNNYCDNYFDRIISIDGNDARGIDVGLLIKKGVSAEIEQIRTHVDEGLNSKYLKKSSRLDSKNTANAIFSRDCLEVDIKTGGEKLTLLVNHFKAQDGKATSTKKRVNQSKRVHELVSDVIAAGRKPIVMGDLNIDTFQKDYDKSLDELYNSSKLIDPFKTLSDKERWTHYYSAKRKVSRLDYILLDKRLQVTATEIFREGLTSKCKQYKGPRLESMKGNDLEASDHCPATVVLEI